MGSFFVHMHKFVWMAEYCFPVSILVKYHHTKEVDNCEND